MLYNWQVYMADVWIQKTIHEKTYFKTVCVSCVLYTVNFLLIIILTNLDRKLHVDKSVKK